MQNKQARSGNKIVDDRKERLNLWGASTLVSENRGFRFEAGELCSVSLCIELMTEGLDKDKDTFRQPFLVAKGIDIFQVCIII